jgi:hypothetical protein
MWRAHHYLRVFVGLSFVAGIPTWALAQDSSAMEKLASRTAHELITRKPKVLVIAPASLAIWTFRSVKRLNQLFVLPYSKQFPEFDLLVLPKRLAT